MFVDRELEICQCCMVVLSGYEHSCSINRETQCAPLELLRDVKDVTALGTDMDDITTFVCDGCGAPVYGNRYEAYVLKSGSSARDFRTGYIKAIADAHGIPPVTVKRHQIYDAARLGIRGAATYLSLASDMDEDPDLEYEEVDSVLSVSEVADVKAIAALWDLPFPPIAGTIDSHLLVKEETL
jgi:hypothetical protein